MTDTIAALERQIATLQAKLEKEKEREQARIAAREQLHAVAEELGYRLDELMGNETPRKPRLKPKYQNPTNPRQTWAGEGRPKPHWVIEFEAAGGNIEECRITN